MERRAVLRSLSAGAAVALAGCPVGEGGDSEPECGTPAGDLRTALPRGGRFGEPTVDVNNSAEEVGGASRHVFASYTTDDGTFLFVIGEYSDAQSARSAADDEELWESFGDDIVGSLVVESFAYVGMGPDESGVRTLMARSGPLNEACVDENLTIL